MYRIYIALILVPEFRYQYKNISIIQQNVSWLFGFFGKFSCNRHTKSYINLDQLTFLNFCKLTYVFSLHYDGIKGLCAQV